MWDRLSLVTPPDDPVTVMCAKLHLRVDHYDDDALIAALIKSAAGMIDGPDGIGYALEAQTWLLTLDEFPRSDGRIRVPLRPVVTIDAVRYLDADGVEQTIAAENYRVSIQGGVGILTPVVSWPVPLDTPGAVRVEFTAGSGTPAPLRAAILLMIGHLYEHREAVAANMAEVPLAWDSIVSRYRSGVVA
jgi:uncharacterized phiE125 gp8 family phage protein